MARAAETGHARRAKKRRRLLVAVAAAAALAVLAYVFIFGRHGYIRRRELAAENARLQSEITELKKENAALRGELNRLEDPAAVEELAREELGLVKEGETVYRFVEKEPAATAEKK